MAFVPSGFRQGDFSMNETEINEYEHRAIEAALLNYGKKEVLKFEPNEGKYRIRIHTADGMELDDSKLYTCHDGNYPKFMRRPIQKRVDWIVNGRAIPISASTIETRTYQLYGTINHEDGSVIVIYKETTFE